MSTFFILFLLACLGAGIITSINQSKRNKHVNSIYVKLTGKGYKAINLATFQDNIVGINAELLCIASIKTENIVEYNLSLLRDYELLSNGVAVFKRSNAVGRAAVGGLLFGGIGAIVGAASSKSKGVNDVKSANLKVYTNDIDSPSITVKIFDTTVLKKAQKTIYLNTAQNFIDKLAIVVK